MNVPTPVDGEIDNQYAPENKPFPKDWSNTVTAMFARESWSLAEAANMLCGFRPDRDNYSIDPANPEPDPFSDSYDHRPWNLDPEELRYWRYLKMAKEAANQGLLKTSHVAVMDNDERLDGKPRPALPAEGVVSPQVFMEWAHRHIESFPEILNAFYAAPKDSKLNPQEQIRILKRELSYAKLRERNLVALIVLLFNFPDHLQRGKTLGMAKLLRLRDKICGDLGKEKLGFSTNDNVFGRSGIDTLLDPAKKNFPKASATRLL